jgi:ribosomal protein L37E
MVETDIRIRCQRCGEQMELKDPAPGDAWRPDQFWVCRRCGRHFWSTYPNPTREKPKTAE